MRRKVQQVVRHVRPANIRLQTDKAVVQPVQPEPITPVRVTPDVLTAVQVITAPAEQIVMLVVREHILQQLTHQQLAHVRHVRPANIRLQMVKVLVQPVQPEHITAVRVIRDALTAVQVITVRAAQIVMHVQPERIQQPRMQRRLEIVQHVKPENIQLQPVKVLVQPVQLEHIIPVRVIRGALTVAQVITVRAAQIAQHVQLVHILQKPKQRHLPHVRHARPVNLQIPPVKVLVQPVQPEPITPARVTRDALTAVQVITVRAAQIVMHVQPERIQQPPMQHHQVHVRHVR